MHACGQTDSRTDGHTYIYPPLDERCSPIISTICGPNNLIELKSEKHRLFIFISEKRVKLGTKSFGKFLENITCIPIKLSCICIYSCLEIKKLSNIIICYVIILVNTIGMNCTKLNKVIMK